MFEAIVHRVLISVSEFARVVIDVGVELVDEKVELRDALNVTRPDRIMNALDNFCVSFVIVFSAARGSGLMLEGFNKELEGGHLVFVHESSIHQIQGLWGF